MDDIATPAIAPAPGTVVNGVMIGHDGQLFLASDQHLSLDYATGVLPIPAGAIHCFAANIRTRRDYVGGRCAYLHVLFPDKHAVLQDKLPIPIHTQLGSAFLDAEADIAGDVFYPLGMLRKLGTEAYLRTDTHMTDAGACHIICAVAERLAGLDGAGLRDAMTRRLNKPVTHTGDLGIKLDPPQSSIETFLDMPKTITSFNNNLRSNNGIVDIYRNTSPMSPKRVLMFGDSFGRKACYLLGVIFTEVVFLRTPFFHAEVYEMIQPDILLTSNVERYLVSCQPDETRPNFFMYPHFASQPYQPSAEFAQAFSAVLSYGRSPYHRFAMAHPAMAAS